MTARRVTAHRVTARRVSTRRVTARKTYRAWTLAKRPSGDLPTAACFALQKIRLPDPEEGEVQVRVEYFSLDPGMRPRLSRDSYIPALKIGEVIEGAALGEVVASKDATLHVGDKVLGGFGWCEGATVSAKMVQRLEPKLFDKKVPARFCLGILGVSGLAAWFGLAKHANLQDGEAILISSAAGPVGKTAAQLARRFVGNGASLRVIGLTSRRKVPELESAGFDAVVTYDDKSPRALSSALKAASQNKGVDVYFDNVGGDTLGAALANMRRGGRIVVSGALSQYHRARPHPVADSLRFITHRLTMAGFVVYDYRREFAHAQTQMAAWLRDGSLTYAEHLFRPITTAPRRYIELLRGRHAGRCLVRV